MRSVSSVGSKRNRRHSQRARRRKCRAQLLVATLLLGAIGGLLHEVQPATAATVGSAPCVQTVDSTTGVFVSSFASGANTVCVVRFTSAGTRSWTPPTGVTEVRVLIVAGGGGGGSGGWAGGGGAGGVVYGTSVPVTPGTARTVTVGGGGSGGNGSIAASGATCTSTHPGKGQNGGDSSFQWSSGTLTANGGGGGGGYGWSNRFQCHWGTRGGSGGGAGEGNTLPTRATSNQQTYAQPAGTTVYGKSGGSTTNTSGVQAGSGGGGAGAQGGDASRDANGTRRPGNGGNGVQINITGASVYYAGGGGGATCSSCAAIPSRTSGGAVAE